MIDDIMEEFGFKTVTHKKVDFYKTNNIEVLIPKNQTTMLYGDSGLGKSYFLGLLCGEIANNNKAFIFYHNTDTNMSSSFSQAYKTNSEKEFSELNENFFIGSKESEKKAIDMLIRIANQFSYNSIVYIIDTFDSSKNLFFKNKELNKEFKKDELNKEDLIVESYITHLNNFRSILNEFEIDFTVIFTHHTNKNSEIQGSYKTKSAIPLIYKIEKLNNDRIITVEKNNSILKSTQVKDFIFKLNNHKKVLKTENDNDLNRFKPLENFENKLPSKISFENISSIIIDRSPIFNNINSKILSFKDLPKTEIGDGYYAVFIPNNYASIYITKNEKVKINSNEELLKGLNNNYYVFSRKNEIYQTLRMTHKKILFAIFFDVLFSQNNNKKTNYFAEINFSNIRNYLSEHKGGTYYQIISKNIEELSNTNFTILITDNDNTVLSLITNFSFFNIYDDNRTNNSVMIELQSSFSSLLFKDKTINLSDYSKMLVSSKIQNQIMFSIIQYLLTYKDIKISYSELIRVLQISNSALKFKSILKKEILESEHNNENLFANLEKDLDDKINTFTNKSMTNLEIFRHFGITIKYQEINKKSYELFFICKRPKEIKYFNNQEKINNTRFKQLELK